MSRSTALCGNHVVVTYYIYITEPCYRMVNLTSRIFKHFPVIGSAKKYIQVGVIQLVRTYVRRGSQTKAYSCVPRGGG